MEGTGYRKTLARRRAGWRLPRALPSLRQELEQHDQGEARAELPQHRREVEGAARRGRAEEQTRQEEHRPEARRVRVRRQRRRRCPALRIFVFAVVIGEVRARHHPRASEARRAWALQPNSHVFPCGRSRHRGGLPSRPRTGTAGGAPLRCWRPWLNLSCWTVSRPLRVGRFSRPSTRRGSAPP